MFPSLTDRPHFLASCYGAIVLAFGGGFPVAQGGEAEEQWLHAYVLVQAGSRMGEEERWPLAIANYAAALEEFEALSTTYPGFRPKLIAYRSEDLKQRIQQANEAMQSGEHDVALRYQEILDATRHGVRSRMELSYEASFRAFVNAQWQLDDLISDHSAELAVLLADQKAYLDEMAESSRASLMGEPEGGVKAHLIEKDLAERLSVAIGDLPSSQDFEPAASGMSSALFPDELVARVRGEWYR